MSRKIHAHTSPRQVIRAHRKSRIKKKIAHCKGETARLVIYRSNRFLYAQVVDDLKGLTLAQANTREKGFEKYSSKKAMEAAKALGVLVGQRAIGAKIEQIVFDRSGYDYHGRVKAVADGAREAGLRF